MLTTLCKEGSKVLGKAVMKTISDMLFMDKMSPGEAEMILGISSDTGDERLRSVFLQMYQANSRENSGSPYLQSKILNAYTLLSTSSNRARCQGDTTPGHDQ